MARYIGPKISGVQKEVIICTTRILHGATWNFVVTASDKAWRGHLDRVAVGHRIDEPRRAYGFHKGFWDNVAEAFADSQEEDTFPGASDRTRTAVVTDSEFLCNLHRMYKSEDGITWIRVH